MHLSNEELRFVHRSDRKGVGLQASIVCSSGISRIQSWRTTIRDKHDTISMTSIRMGKALKHRVRVQDSSRKMDQMQPGWQ